HIEALAAERGYRYVHSGNEPLLIAGVGTLTLELLEERPEIDVIIVPVGGGSGAAAACIVAKAIDPTIRVIGVQAEGAPAAYQTWKKRRPVETARIDTFAEGLATRTSFSFPQAIMAELLDDFVLVSDAQIRGAIRLLIEKAHTLTEGAGAAPLAAALLLRDQLAGRRVALVLSGGNLSPDQLREIMNEAPAERTG
ncbi:MAG TPA: pyridoxal-phosphate dependent enzyme, partial [Dehalococcoidia bacterium]